MSWQEQLRRIDAALAAGKLSKEQYAAKREELLAEASSTPSPSREPNEAKLPKRPQSHVSAQALLTTDRPTTAPSPADERSTDSMPHPATVQRRAEQVPTIAARELPPPVPERAVTGASPSRRPLEPPMPDRSDPSDVHSSGALPTWLFLTAGIVLTLALIGGGLWWLTTGPNDEQTAGDPPVSSPPTTTTPPADLVDRLPQLPGVLNLDSGTVSTTEGEHRKFFGKGEAVVLRERDVKTVTWKGSSRQVGDADVGYTLLVAHNSDSSAAAATARAFGQLGKLHAKPVGRLAGRHDFPTYRLRTGDTTLQFVVYHSGRYTLHLSVVRTGDRDDTWLTGQLKGLVSEVAATLPPDR